MKLHADKRDIERSGDLAAHGFKIKSTAKAFAILSSGLYANKIRAVIRELSCNAYDAHIAAGKKDVPIEIKLPSAIDLRFYVKDFGIGLDHDGVTELYTTYFESTKGESNDFIGALGLGSKSPFSYCTSFNVEARYNGTKRFYTAVINELGVPEIVLMTENPTDEENGLTVSFEVRRDDIDKFYNEARHALMYFNPQPNVIGRASFEPFKVKSILDGNRWNVREADYYASLHGAHIVQGFVTYPIDSDVMLQNNLSAIAQKVIQMNIDIRVDIGDVEVAASREGLSYTKQTIANIKTRLEQIAEEMSATIQQQLDMCDTLWDARIKYMKLMNDKNHVVRSMYEAFDKTIGFTWKKTKLSSQVIIDIQDIDNTSLNVVYKNRSSKSLRQLHGFTPENKKNFVNVKTNETKFELAVQPKMVVVFDDIRGAADVVRQWLDSQERTDEHRVVMIRPAAKDVADASFKEANKIVKRLGDPKLVLASDLGFQKVKKSYYKSRKAAKNHVGVWAGFRSNGGYRKDQLRRVFSAHCWNVVEVDPTEGGYYVPIDRHTILNQNDGHEVTMFDRIVDASVNLGFLPADIKVYGLNQKDQAAMLKRGKWLNVFDVVNAKFDAANKDDKLQNAIAAHSLVEVFGRGLFEHVVGRWGTVANKLNDGEFKTLMKDVREMCDNTYNVKTVQDLMMNLHKTELFNAITESVTNKTQRWNTIRESYQLFKIIDWSKLNDRTISIVIDYVNLIDNVA